MKGLFSISLAVVLALCLSTLAFPANTVMAAGDDWYVAPTGSDTTGDGSQGHPWKTIGKALSLNQVTSGDTVHAASGNYSEDIVMKIGVTIQGSGANVTTIRGTGNGPVVYANNLGSGAKLDGFTITNGSAGMGGGISLQVRSSPTISNCIITGNSAGYGGGILIYDNSSPTIINCLITDNSATYGGGISALIDSSPTVINSTITDNEAGDGGGMYNWSSNPTVKNSIVYGNTSISSGDPNNISNYGSSVTTVTYSCIEGVPIYEGTGNINDDPSFVDPGYWDDSGTPEDTSDDYWVEGDYHLKPGSPCIDTGTSAGAPSIDLDGVTRPQGAGVDMGAYELPEYTLTIDTEGEGNVGQSPSPPYYQGDDTEVTLTANAGTGYTFDHWEGALDGSTNPETITMTDNKTVTAVFTIAIQTVEIDIKPGSDPNSINPDSQGVIPVAILTTPDFDAASVNATTVLFGQTGYEAAPVHYALEDVNDDGDIDMILQFKTQETGIEAGDNEATLTGQTTGGIEITGTDSVSTVPPEDKGQGNNNPNKGKGNNSGKGNTNPGQGSQNGNPNPVQGNNQDGGNDNPNSGQGNNQGGENGNSGQGNQNGNSNPGQDNGQGNENGNANPGQGNNQGGGDDKPSPGQGNGQGNQNGDSNPGQGNNQGGENGNSNPGQGKGQGKGKDK